MKHRRIYTVLIALQMLSLSLAAGLSWTPKEGLKSSGGLSRYIVGEEEEDPGRLNAQEWIERGDSLMNQGKHKEGIKAYEHVVQAFPSSEYAPIALVKKGDYLQRKGKYHKAFNVYQSVVQRFPDYEEYDEVVQRQYEVANRLNEKSKKGGLLGWFKRPDKEKLMGYYDTVIQNAPQAPRAPQCLLEIADLNERQKKPDQAMETLDRVVGEYPKTQASAEATLMAADLQRSLVKGPRYDQGATRLAIKYYEDFLYLYGNDAKGGPVIDSSLIERAERGRDEMKEMLAESKFSVGEFYLLSRRNPRSARTFYVQARSVAPDSEVAMRANQRIEGIKEGRRPDRLFLERVFGQYKEQSVDREEALQVQVLENREAFGPQTPRDSALGYGL